MTIKEKVTTELLTVISYFDKKIQTIEQRLGSSKLEVDDQYTYQYERGQAVKRMSTPLSPEEASALGEYNVLMNLSLNSLKSLELDINRLCGLHDFELTHMADNIFRGTASKKGLRLHIMMDTIKSIPPDFNQPNQTMVAPQPIQYGYEDTKQGERNTGSSYKPDY